MKLTGESKILIGILVFTAVVIGLASVVMTQPAKTYTKEEMIPQSAHTKGNPSAKTYLVEFSDFQCPACLAAKPTVDAILKKYPDDLVFVYRHFPLDQHEFGKQAAVAAEAAGKQGKFWEAYEYLFVNQASFSKDMLNKTLPEKLSLNPETFAKDAADQALLSKVLEDQSAGLRLGVNATPTFFLNGQKMDLMSFDDLAKKVDEAINNAK